MNIKALLLTVLLAGDVFALTEATPIPMVTVLPTAIPTSYPTPPFGVGQPLKTRTVCNLTNQDLHCADGNYATPAPYIVPAGACSTYNYAANGLQMSRGVGACIRPANTPASGYISVEGSR